MQSDGTNWISSTPTYPTAAGAVGYTIRSDATNLASYPAQLVNSSVASQSPTTSDVYLTGSNIVVTAGDMKAKGQYKCVFDMTKSRRHGRDCDYATGRHSGDDVVTLRFRPILLAQEQA